MTMRILLSDSAPEFMDRKEFWAKFFIGTHWRNPIDNAEVVVRDVRYHSFGDIDECQCDACNNQYSVMGSKVRNFPFRSGIMYNYSTSFSELVRNGFLLIPDAIQTTNTSVSTNRDGYLNQLRNVKWGDENLHTPSEEYELSGQKGNRFDEPIAYLSMGIPPGRLVLINRLVLGGKPLGPNYTYHEVYR